MMLDATAATRASSDGAALPKAAASRPGGAAGGHRLDAAHYETERVPREVRDFAGEPESLRVGSPGKVGLMQLEFARNGDTTELVGHYQKSPLQIMRPLYFNPLRPDMPYTFLMSTGGGFVSGDRHRTDLIFGPDTAAHVTTQAFTKLYRMEAGYAASTTNITLGPGAYVEFLPDPVIPFADSRFFQRIQVVVDDTATLVLGETVYAGRLARGERNRYDVFASDLEVRRPDGRIIALDRVRLRPKQGAADGLAVLGGHDIFATLCVFTPLMPAQQLADELHTRLDETLGDDPVFGVSILPEDAGVWLRMIGDDPTAIARANTVAAAAAHELLTGNPAPSLRKR